MKKLQLIKNAKKIVIKIGSSLLIDNGKFNYKWLEDHLLRILIASLIKLKLSLLHLEQSR